MRQLASPLKHTLEELSPSTRLAFEYALGSRLSVAERSTKAVQSAGSTETFVSTSTLLVGVLRAHPNDSDDNPLRDLLRHHDLRVEELYATLRARMEGHTPFDPDSGQSQQLNELPTMTENMDAVLDAAFELANRVPDPPPRLPLRFLFGGLLQVQRGRGYHALVQLMGSESHIAEIGLAYPDFLRLGPDAVYADFLRERFPRASRFAGFTADSTDGADRLGRDPLIDQVARLLTAKNLQTPVAIGLFGDWGSGKSFFMRRLMERIEALSTRAAAAEMTGGRTSYCGYVRQVSFNAWFHSDGEIWPSLAAQVFRAVSGERSDVPADEGALEALRSFWAKQNPRYKDANDRRQSAEEEETEARAEATRLTIEAEQLRGEIATSTLDALGEEAANAILGGQALEAVISRRERIRKAIGKASKSWKLSITSAVVLATALSVLAILNWDVAIGLATGAATAVATVGGIIAKTHGFMSGAFKGERERKDREAKAREARRQIEGAATKKAEAEQELAQLASVGLTSAYAVGQAELWAGREHLGVVSEIRRSFDQLSTIIEQSRTLRRERARTSPSERAAHPRGQAKPPHIANPAEADLAPIDRIVVYIDDLDRCQPELVVKVLEAIKLLMDVQHFVVIVGVDSRWLFRSLELRFHELIESAGGGSDREGADEWAATPQNYLEKIFQFSLRLPRMTPAGYAALVHGLFGAGEASGDEEREGRVDSPPPPEPVGEVPGEGQIGSRGLASPAPSATEHSGAEDKASDLVLSSDELRMLAALAPLIETPRSAKRVTNVYRLLRVIHGERACLVNDAYAGILVLLGIVVGFPRESGRVFQALVHEKPDVAWASFIDRLVPRAPVDTPDVLGNVAMARIPTDDVDAWRRMSTQLSSLIPEMGAVRTCGSMREWARWVGDFTFHPWRGLDGERAVSSSAETKTS